MAKEGDARWFKLVAINQSLVSHETLLAISCTNKCEQLEAICELLEMTYNSL